ANAGSAGVKPASITNGVSAIHSAGSTLANIDSDLGLAVQALSDAGSDLTFAAWVMNPRTWLYLNRLPAAGGAPAFPDLTNVRDGGFLIGLPAIVSTGVPIVTSNTSITLLDPSQIIVADDNGGALEVSTNTALAMLDNPSAPSTSVSMFQT